MPSDNDTAEAGQRLQDFARRFIDEWGGRPLEPQDLVDFAAKAVPHTIATGLTLVREGQRPTTLAATDKLAEEIDELEYATGEGPCLDALDYDDITWTNDLESESRWPHFRERALRESSIRSMFGVRVFLGGTDRGALNFYAPEAGAFTQFDLGTGGMLSTLASLALQSAIHQRKAANLEIALESSRQIGTAIGILMARQLVTADQAFDLLRQASQRLNRKVRDVAVEVLETGTLPEFDRDR